VNLLIEKPIADTVEGAEKIIKKAKEMFSRPKLDGKWEADYNTVVLLDKDGIMRVAWRRDHGEYKKE